MNEPAEFLTDRQVAARYGIDRTTVWAWKRKGALPAPIKLGESVSRWRLADLQAFEEQRAREAA